MQVCELGKLPGERSVRYFPDLNSSVDIAIYNAIKLCHNGGVAIYIGQQRSMKTVFTRLIELEKRGLDLSAFKSVANEEELNKLNDLTNMFLVFAEDEAKERHIMTMKDWIDATDSLIKYF